MPSTQADLEETADQLLYTASSFGVGKRHAQKEGDLHFFLFPIDKLNGSESSQKKNSKYISYLTIKIKEYLCPTYGQSVDKAI